MKKRIICVVLALVLFVGGATTAVAMGVVKNITAELRSDMTIIIDGEVKKFVDANGATVYPI